MLSMIKAVSKRTPNDFDQPGFPSLQQQNHKVGLLEKKTESTAAYAAHATIISSFVAPVTNDTSSENKMMETDMVIKCASLVA